ncbi:MAG TPA: hypothetical protein VLA47_05560, partial [Nitrospira sp.]|nr:hypothetical protein [Nitrospira sp.]
GATTLLRARIRLDWGAWVGLKPSGLIHETRLNLATKPGWQRLTADDLRAMAAQALRVSIEDVRWFYRDDDLSISPTGMATIRHRKDAWYVLEHGDFAQARFMSCMGAMHWASIDFLPVVELFKSLLPGTGSAAFELIRGLYDDQNEGRRNPPPLRYRGIPPYPSEAAFRLFRSFFDPHAPAGKNPLTLFMNPAKASQVEWLPSPTPPSRYFDRSQGACLTIQGSELQKVTLAEDSTGLPFMSPKGRAFLPCDRAAQVINNRIVLNDRDVETILSTAVPASGDQSAPVSSVPISLVDWRSVFVEGIPPIAAAEAYGAVLLYPDDDTPIGELAGQPFVADYLEDVAEQDREIGRLLAQARQVLIHNGDAVIASCVAFDRPRDYTVVVQHPAFAQKQAQQLWTTCAQLRQWDWLKRIRFISMAKDQSLQLSTQGFDVIYQWIPAGTPESLVTAVNALRRALRPGGCAFVTGPAILSECWKRSGLTVIWQEPVEELPTFRMHRTILPQARLKDDLTLYRVQGG